MSDESDNFDYIFGKNTVLAFLENQTRSVEKHTAGNDGKTAAADRTNIQQLPGLTARAHIYGAPASIHKIHLSEGLRPDGRIDAIKRKAKQLGIPVMTVDKRKLEKMLVALPGEEKNHQGVLAQISQVEPLELSQFLATLNQERSERASLGEKPKNELVVILDGIEDPHNLGAIMRVAEAAGARAILLPVRRSAGVTHAVAKSSAGASATLPVVNVQNLVRAIEKLKEAQFWIAGLAHDAKLNHFQADLQRPLAVIIGNEGRGLSRLVGEHCDFHLRIPMLGQTASLNASVAAGVVLYEFVRQNLETRHKVK